MYLVSQPDVPWITLRHASLLSPFLKRVDAIAIRSLIAMASNLLVLSFACFSLDYIYCLLPASAVSVFLLIESHACFAETTRPCIVHVSRYIIAEVNYGGRVTDDKDMVTPSLLFLVMIKTPRGIVSPVATRSFSKAFHKDL